MYDYLLFDLDGTLTDPKEGITKSVQYALKAFGIDEPDLDKLEPFIGPPLKDSFMQFYGFDDAKAEEAVAKYRENFKDIGIFQNQVYDGIPKMLRNLKAEGKRLAVSSSKPTVFVERILEHFKLRHYFDVVVGSELDGSRVAKEEVVEEALKQLLNDRKYGHEEVVIIGDRKFDVEGGMAHDITTVAVSYGYGSLQELKDAKAEFIVRDVPELERFLLRGSEKPKPMLTWDKIWYIMFPVLIGYFLLQIANYIGVYVIAYICDTHPAMAEYLAKYGADGQITELTGNGSAVMNLVAYVVVGIVMSQMAKRDLDKAEKAAAKLGKVDFKLILLGIASVIGMTLGLNLLFDLIGFTGTSEAFTSMQEQRYSVPFIGTLIVYCIFAPIAEEYLFRGLLYNRVKKHMSVASAMFISAFLFGVYHGNLISGTYAFLMGLLIAWLYEKTDRYYVAVGAHMLANLSAYVLSYLGAMRADGGGAVASGGVLSGVLYNWPACLILLVLGVVCIWRMKDAKHGLL